MQLVHTSHRLRVGGLEKIELGFEVFKWSGDIRNNEPEKCSKLKWFSLDELPDNMIPFARQVLRKISKNEPYSEQIAE